MRQIQTKTIAVGVARAEGRAPSHDGEYITVYRVDGDNDVIAENNAGTFSFDDQGDEDQDWDEIREEARSESGWEPMSHCGSEAREEMIALGWAVAEDFDGNWYPTHQERKGHCAACGMPLQGKVQYACPVLDHRHYLCVGCRDNLR